MRWWLRLVVTLLLTPLLWRLVTAYLANQQGMSWNDLLQQSPTILGGLYLMFTLPALVLCGAVLTLSDFVLDRLGLALLTVVVSPLLAWGVVALIVHFVPEPHAQAVASAMSLFVAYGLVWGLTIREPHRRLPARRATAAAELDSTTANTAGA